MSKALILSLVGVGSLLCLTPLANAAQITSSEASLYKQPALGNFSSDRSILIAQETGCPQSSGGSQFVAAETKNFLVYICGGDLPNTYVGVAKDGTTGRITLPLQSYENDQFVAVNGDIRYTLTRNELIVTQNGREIAREAAKWRR